MRKYLYISIAAVLVFGCSQQRDEKQVQGGDSIESTLRQQEWADVYKALHWAAVDSLDEALSLLDSVGRNHPEPTLYFMQAVFCDMKRDTVQAETFLHESLHLYDSLLGVRPGLSNSLDRAVILQRLYGKERYWGALDSIRLTHSFDSVLFYHQMSYDSILRWVKEDRAVFVSHQNRGE